ncbi:MAG: hypothetical protein J5923_02640 [Acidaminococcaceae bacterium]|nr:hypothetical protein [Acidaminococcaceae bacterium]
MKWQGKCGTVSAAFTCTGRPAITASLTEVIGELSCNIAALRGEAPKR